MSKKKWFRTISLLLALFMAMAIFVGCNQDNKPPDASDSQPGASDDPGSGEGKTIGFSIASLAGNPFWQVMLDRLVDGYKALGYDVKYADARGDVSTQLTDIQTFIGMGVDCIVINPFGSDSVVDVSLEAKAAGIPVFACDIPISDTGYSIATFICDNWALGYEHGKLAASQFAKGDKIEAVIISGYPGGDDSWDRRYGFITGLADYQIENYSSTNFDIVYQIYCNYEQELAYEKMVDIITRFAGKFDVIFCENDAMALGAITALEEAGLKPSDYRIHSVDGIRQSYEAIMAGTLFATGVNSPVDVADLTVKYTHQYLNGDKSVSGTYYTEYAIVTAQNVNEYYDSNSLY